VFYWNPSAERQIYYRVQSKSLEYTMYQVPGTYGITTSMNANTGICADEPNVFGFFVSPATGRLNSV